MICIYCGSPLDVLNSRPQKRQNQTWRRRRCLNCSAVFTTHESIELNKGLKVDPKKTGNLQPFSRDKLFLSIYNSCRHLKEPVDIATALTDTVIAAVSLQSTNGVLPCEVIKDTANTVLKRFDAAAAVQYSAFHP